VNPCRISEDRNEKSGPNRRFHRSGRCERGIEAEKEVNCDRSRTVFVLFMLSGFGQKEFVGGQFSGAGLMIIKLSALA